MQFLILKLHSWCGRGSTRKNKSRLRFTISLVLILFVPGFTDVVSPHSIIAHKYIAAEAARVWQAIPEEMQNHIHREFVEESQDTGIGLICYPVGTCAQYNRGDEVVVGSSEEDGEVIIARQHNIKAPSFAEHFWDPDAISEGKLNVDIGVTFDSEWIAGGCISFGGSYLRAESLWKTIISLYQMGDEEIREKAYYYLGKVAHLLTDLAVPAHVHGDVHPGIEGIAGKVFRCGEVVVAADDDSFEKFMKNIDRLELFKGNSIKGKEYLYEDLLNDQRKGFLWKDVYSSRGTVPHLFKLFYYTAQKTQYFASDGDPSLGLNRCVMEKNQKAWGDTGVFVRADGSKGSFSPILWKEEILNGEIKLVDIVANPCDIEKGGRGNKDNLIRLAGALIPHAMKAVAGLYRLFWYETHPPRPFVTASLKILESPPYRIGEPMTAQFTIENRGETPLAIDALTVGGRVEGRCPDNKCPDFEWKRWVNLRPNDLHP